MEKLKTATQREYNCDSFVFIETPSRLYIRIQGESLATVAAVFANPAETMQLWWCDQYVAHHTKLIAIVPEMDAIRVVLGKE